MTLFSYSRLFASIRGSKKTCSYPKHLHHLVAEVVDDLDGDAAGAGAWEWAGGIAVEGGPGVGVDSALRVVLRAL